MIDLKTMLDSVKYNGRSYLDLPHEFTGGGQQTIPNIGEGNNQQGLNLNQGDQQNMGQLASILSKIMSSGA